MLAVDQKVVLFLQVVLVVGLPLLFWRPLRLGQFFPLPILQIFAGIILGPSIFGALAPETFSFFFHKNVLSGVETLANVALVLFVFLAGCEMDRQILRQAAGMVLKVGVTGVTLPWIAGTAAAALLVAHFNVPGLLGPLNNPTLYAISFGLCMAVTALPVLVVILRELGFNEKPIGTIALAIGGVDDVLLWSSLTILLPFAAGSDSLLMGCGVALGGAVLTVVVLRYAVAPYLDYLIRQEAPERFLISVAIIVLFLFAALNEATQLHAAIGAFLTGLLLPDKVRELAEDRLDTPVTLLLLPFLFLSTGLKTQFNFADTAVWAVVVLALAVCVGGKFIGITLPAYLSRESLPFSITLGVLMQCKGLMEIVVVTVLYQKGVIGQVTFSALVLVALISTAMTVPLSRLCVRVFGDAATEPRMVPGALVADTGEPVLADTALVAQGPVLVFEGGEVPITKPDTVIGRHSSDDVRVNDVRVSRRHARITGNNGRYEIHNLTAVRSEPNPVLVNGVEREHAPLHDGDVISLGGVLFTFKAKPTQMGRAA